MTASPTMRTHPLHDQLLENAAWAQLRPALYPNLSEANAGDGERALERLAQHGERVYGAYAAGRERFPAPFLLNISSATPAAVQLLIERGVRVFSTSCGSKTELRWMEEVVRAHPEILFVVAAPHISGNSISVEALQEEPSLLATRGYPNVVLVGCAEFYEYQLEAHREGRTLGSAENPFAIASQPVGPNVRQYLMMTCASTREFVEGFGATSAAAPHLASLLGHIVDRQRSMGRSVDAASVLAAFERTLHEALAQDKAGAVLPIRYFTLDTVLLAHGQPLRPEATWRDFAPHPGPLPLQP